MESGPKLVLDRDADEDGCFDDELGTTATNLFEDIQNRARHLFRPTLKAWRTICKSSEAMSLILNYGWSSLRVSLQVSQPLEDSYWDFLFDAGDLASKVGKKSLRKIAVLV